MIKKYYINYIFFSFYIYFFRKNNKAKNFIIIKKLYFIYFNGDWGLGIGDWGLGSGAQPQSP